jgi:MFS family permease
MAEFARELQIFDGDSRCAANYAKPGFLGGNRRMSVSPQSLGGGVVTGPLATAATGAKYALFLLFAINLLNFFDRQLLGALAEPIRHEFHLSDTALGFLGTVFTIIYALVGLPLGALSDRWSRRKLIALGTTFWSLLTAATGFAQNFAQMFVARLGVGVGEATCAPASQSLIGDLYPPHQRAKAMGVFMLGLPAGIFLAYISAGAIATKYGWRAAFWFACIPGIILAVMALRIPEPVRGALDAGRVVTTATNAVKSPFATVLALPTMWWIILSGVFHNFNMYAINAFNTAFLQRFHGLSLLNASYVNSISVGAVGAIGLLVGGSLADKMSAKRRNGRLVLSACSMTIAAPCIFMAINQPKGSLTAYVLFMSVGTITMFVYYATVYSAIQDVIEPRLRGTAVAIYFCFMYILGASVGPVGTGALSDHFALKAMTDAGATTMTEAFKAIGLHNAMYAIPILALAAAFVLFMASRTMDKDVRKQEMAR